MAFQIGSTPLEISIDFVEAVIRLHGDLTGSYEAKLSLSQELTKAAGKARWIVDAADIRVDESGVEAWAEYVQLLLMHSKLTYRPSQLASILRFDDGLVYNHQYSEFEER
jgi:hypothetical protein